MKHLILATLLISVCCNPFNADTVTVYVQSDNYTNSFEAGKKAVQNHFDAFIEFNQDGVLIMDKLCGVSLKNIDGTAIFHFVGYKPDTTYQHDFTLEYDCNKFLFDKIVGVSGDTLLLNNLKVWY